MDPRKTLRKWRGKRTFREAGQALDCDPSFVRYLEVGERSPGLAVAVRIRDEVGIPIEAWSQPATRKAS